MTRINRCGLSVFVALVATGSPAVAEIDVRSYTLEIDLEPEQERLSGVATLAVEADGEPDIVLDLVGMEVDSVRVDGEEAAVSRGVEGRTVRITPVVAPEAGQVVSVEVRYQGQPEPYVAPWGTWGVVWNEERVFTVNVTEGARTWFPCHDVLRDKATLELTVVAASEWEVAGPGERVLVEERGEGRKATTWRADWPQPTYTMHFAAGRYEVIEESHGGLPYVYYLYPGSWEAGEAAETLGHAPDVMELFRGRYGAYPFGKVGFDEIELGGAVEHPSIISMGNQLFAPSRSRTYSEVVAHELAHSWFQGQVTIYDWPDLWLSEGLATYHEALYFAHQRPDDPEALGDYTTSMALSYTSVAEMGEGYFPLYDPDVLFGVTVYRKGALVFHMLRYLVGDEAFDAVLVAYLERYGFGEAVSTAMFEELATEVSRVELGPFFDQWVYRAGHPDYRVSWRVVDESADPVVVDVRVRQAQRDGWGPFTLPVELEFSAGEDSAHRARVEVDGPDVRAQVQVPFVPDAVDLDPDRWLLMTWDEEPFEEPGGDDVGAMDGGDEVGVEDGGGEDTGIADSGEPTDAGAEDSGEPMESGGGDGGGCGCGLIGSAPRSGWVWLVVVGLVWGGGSRLLRR